MNSASGRTHSCGHTHAARDAVRGSFDRKTGTVGIGVADVAAGVVIGLAAILAAPGVQATPLTIVNPGFEADVQNEGGFSFSATGWTVSGTAGTFRPIFPATYSFNPGFNSDNVGYFNWTSAGSSLAQTLGDTFSAGLDYTLTFNVGDRLDRCWLDGSFAAIYAGTPLTIVKQQVLVNSGNDDCQSGQFEFFDTQTLSLSASEAAAYVGQPIGIIFGFSPAPGLIGDQANIDNVSLNASTIPAPATLALLLAGVLGPAVTARRRRAQAPR